jgi:hypothetical protein
MHFHIWKTAPGPTPAGWTPLDLTYGDRNCLTFRFLAPDTTKQFQAPRHSRLLKAQFINNKKNISNLSNMPIIFCRYRMKARGITGR